MIVPSLCALLLLGPPADPKPTLVARYRQFNDAVAKNDGKAMIGWFERHAAAGFNYTSKDGHRYGRKDFLNGLRDQTRAVQKSLKSVTKVTRVDVKGNTATASVQSEFEGQVKFDTAILRLVDKSTTRDTWTLGQKGWMLTRSVQTEADTQMFKE
ncbi:MAG: nuclear transport factor 2 family protein [Fimbriimonas sp.]